ncbi:unnamed protein product [Cylindrotheca closterium]|uniref:DUF6824 domain-containing protein n=1 Tax=Cylindrotheca closterium TaxID=2856 RepID=A0AAD2FFW1_9STRA|nr:unnamed protein product [Cylindrotheca closterium]
MASFIQHDSLSQNGTSWLSCFDCSDRNSESSGNNAAYMTVPFEHKSLQTGDEMKQTEAYLAAELNKLTVQERAKAMDDIHCVGEELNETPEMIEQSLREFDHLLQKMKTPTYEMAVNQNKAFVEDPSFRLRFLRCNMHDVNRSVRQMMEFLKHKATYFGEDNVAREITLDDLDDEDMSLLLSGLYHIQDGRDRKGRVVMHATTDMLGGCKTENIIHVAYYMWNNILLSIPEVQTKGLVIIFYDLTKPGKKFVMPRFNTITYTNVLLSFPLRYSAMHMCLKKDTGNLPLYNALVNSSIYILPQQTRARIRLFYGTDIEIHYYLRSHGIPTDNCPVDFYGSLRMDILNNWFENHKATIDAGNDPSSGYPPLPQQALASERDWAAKAIIPEGVSDLGILLDNHRLPSSHDVLLGRGWKLQNHEGNVRFRLFVEGYIYAYDNTPRQQRRWAAKAIIPEGVSDLGILLDNHRLPSSHDVLLGRGWKLQNHEGNVRFRLFVEGYIYAYDNTPRQQRRWAAKAIIPEGVSDLGILLDNHRLPSSHDVLLGRGWKLQNHEGNVRFRLFVEGYIYAYDNTPRQQRREFSYNLARLLRGKGVKFWKKTKDGVWREGTLEDSEKKVGDLFRSIRRKLSS